jgi:hypothetical protein
MRAPLALKSRLPGTPKMKANLHPDDIRELVKQVFTGLGAEPASLSELHETLLVDQGRCVARSYSLGGLMAMWLVEVGLVQFYDADGNMLRTATLVDDPEPRRRAA